MGMTARWIFQSLKRSWGTDIHPLGKCAASLAVGTGMPMVLNMLRAAMLVFVLVENGCALKIFVMILKKMTGKMIQQKKTGKMMHPKMILMYKVSDGSEEYEQQTMCCAVL